MKIFDKIRQAFQNAKKYERYQMISDMGNGFYSFNGNLYQSDVVRACIKPKTKAIGKAVAKHIRKSIGEDGKTELKVNPEPYIRFLLEEPNPLMTGQVMQEKIANQLALNSNAFILIVKDDNGYPIELYPIPCTSVYTEYRNNILWLRFYYRNGKNNAFPYTEIIHIRDDFFNNDVFGERPIEALEELMECITTTDQGIVKAIKNSSVIQWLLKFSHSMRQEDIKQNVENFVKNYLKVTTETFGAAGVDAKTDIQRIEPKDYVPNAAINDRITDRVYSFFGTNKKIVQNNYNEDEWIAYYEGCIEPVIQQMSEEYTRKIFTRRERGFGNKIVFEAANLSFASMSTKMQLVQLVDRGIMTPNEVREVLHYAPIPGGDKALLRKDTGILTEGDTEAEGNAENENN